MDKLFRIGDFCFRLQYPEEITPPLEPGATMLPTLLLPLPLSPLSVLSVLSLTTRVKITKDSALVIRAFAPKEPSA